VILSIVRKTPGSGPLFRHSGAALFLSICGIKKMMPFKEIGKDYPETSKN
jgi:hypothetical protein